jgi:hypothetical protein
MAKYDPGVTGVSEYRDSLGRLRTYVAERVHTVEMTVRREWNRAFDEKE